MMEAWSMLVRLVARTLALFVLWLFSGVTVALGQTPDFTGISLADRQAMEQTCRGELLVSGPAANLRCLSNQIEQIRRVTAAPDFTGIAAADRQAMEQTCRGELLVSGPAANLRCLSNQIEQIRRVTAAPDFTGIAAADRQAMEQTCRGRTACERTGGQPALPLKSDRANPGASRQLRTSLVLRRPTGKRWNKPAGANCL